MTCIRSLPYCRIFFHGAILHCTDRVLQVLIQEYYQPAGYIQKTDFALMPHSYQQESRNPGYNYVFYKILLHQMLSPKVYPLYQMRKYESLMYAIGELIFLLNDSYLPLSMPVQLQQSRQESERSGSPSSYPVRCTTGKLP